MSKARFEQQKPNRMKMHPSDANIIRIYLTLHYQRYMRAVHRLDRMAETDCKPFAEPNARYYKHAAASCKQMLQCLDHPIDRNELTVAGLLASLGSTDLEDLQSLPPLTHLTGEPDHGTPKID